MKELKGTERRRRSDDPEAVESGEGIESGYLYAGTRWLHLDFVESGEGIERRPVADAIWSVVGPVESGEGIERSSPGSPRAGLN